MAITQEQLEARRKFVGSSDIAALFSDSEGMSLSPWANAKDVYISKVYGIEKNYGNASTKAGNRYESMILEYAKEELGVEIETAPEKMNFVCEKYPWLAANLDGYTLTSSLTVGVNPEQMRYHTATFYKSSMNFFVPQ
jgi:hypothetical protein